MKYLILPSLLTLMACGDVQTEYVYVAPDIPAETLTPCPISDRKVTTTKDLAVLATEHLKSAECANGKIQAIKEIVDKDVPNPA